MPIETITEKNGRIIVEVKDVGYDGLPDCRTLIIAKDNFLEYLWITTEELENIPPEDITFVDFNEAVIVLHLKKPTPLENSSAVYTYGPYILVSVEERIIGEIQRIPGISDVQLFSLDISAKKIAEAIKELLIEKRIVEKKCSGFVRFFPPKPKKLFLWEIIQFWSRLIEEIKGNKGSEVKNNGKISN